MKMTVSLDGIGLILPGAHEAGRLCGAVGESIRKRVRQIDEIPLPRGANVRALRRSARLTRLALHASDKAYRGASYSGADTGLYVGLTHGTTSLLREFHDYLYDYGPDSTSPNAFSNGVTNAPMSTVSRQFGITGGGCTLVGRQNVGLEALRHAAFSLETGEHKQCLVGAAEEYSDLVEHVYRGCGEMRMGRWERRSEPMGEGAVFVRLTHAEQSDIAYTALDNIEGIRPDLVVTDLSVAALRSGGHRALRLSLEALSVPIPVVLGTGAVFGELHSVSSLLSVSVARDIVMHQTRYPPELLVHSSPVSSKLPEFSQIRTVLIVSFGADGSVSYGMVSHSDEVGA